MSKAENSLTEHLNITTHDPAKMGKRLPPRSEKASALENAPDDDMLQNLPEENGGNGKAEPIRYGDWEVSGRCTDF